MTRISNALLLAATSLLMSGSSAYAQEDYCNVQARKICGDNQTISQCFEDQAMWDNLDPICTGTVQTIIENEREALQQQ